MRMLDMQERDALAAQMRAHYEAGKPHRPRAAPFDITADNLMLGLLEIAEKALRTTPPVNQDAVREAIARIVDPEKWQLIDYWRTYYHKVGHQRLQKTAGLEAAPSLTKADEILAALSSSISPVDERLFDLLEGLKARLDANGHKNGAAELSSCFARITGGAEISRIIDTIAPVRSGRRVDSPTKGS